MKEFKDDIFSFFTIKFFNPINIFTFHYVLLNVPLSFFVLLSCIMKLP